MTTIFVNGLKSKTGGGKSILNDYLSEVAEGTSSNRYVVLTPDKSEYEKYARPNVEIVDIPSAYKHNVLLPALYLFALPKLLRDHRVDVILNFGDIVVPSAIPQVYLFDWPFAIYRDKVAWERLSLLDYVTQKVKLFVFNRYLKHATVVVAQTATVKERLEAKFQLKNITIVPVAVPREHLCGGQFFDFRLPKDKTKLLYPANYYPHKNLEVLIPLATLIRDRALPYHIVTTISPRQHSKAAAFLEIIRTDALKDVITNVGHVAMTHMPSLYSQCDALLMPTLLETFSLPYVESMFHRKVILTSNRDFAEDVCGEAAVYFDPMDPESILRAIESAFGTSDVRREKEAEGKRRLSRVPSGRQVFLSYQELLDELVDTPGRRSARAPDLTRT